MAERMTTGGFFRKLIKHAVYGEPNPITEVIQEGIKHGSEKETKVIETQGEEDGNPEHEGAKR